MPPSTERLLAQTTGPRAQRSVHAEYFPRDMETVGAQRGRGGSHRDLFGSPIQGPPHYKAYMSLFSLS